MNLRGMEFSAAIAIGLVLVLAGCAGTSTGSPAESNTGTPAAATSASPTAAPATSTAPASTSAAAAAPAPSRTGAVGAAGPATVVQAYFAAINAQDYQEAWALGGDNLGQSYAQFVGGFAGTAQDTVEILATSGNAVSVDLTATQTDGSQQQFTGTYYVTSGAISSASITQVNSTPPENAALCGAPQNPYGYNYCGNGSEITSPPSDICTYFRCIDNFWNGRGYMVECNDTKVSMSGGIEGVCSDNGGVDRRVSSG
jgi:hypothetical protein